jgi:G:T-mismatch repair DNA endonuclease (very short patch repair protein)
LSALEREKIRVYTLFSKETVDELVFDYKEEKYSVNGLPLDISNYLRLLGVKRTSKQERQTMRYKTVYMNAIQEKYGPDITNISQVSVVQKKKEETYSKNYGSYENYLKGQRNAMFDGYKKYVGTDKHKEAQQKKETTCLKKYGVSNFGHSDIAKEKTKRTKAETIALWSYEERLERTAKAREAVTSRGGYSSKPEKKVQKCLVEIGIEFQSNKMKWNYSWDIIFENFIIEVQGIMWHAKPSIYKDTDLIMGKLLAKSIWEKDARKRKKAEEEGFILIEIWEDEINKSSEEDLIKNIKERLIEYGYEC